MPSSDVLHFVGRNSDFKTEAGLLGDFKNGFGGLERVAGLDVARGDNAACRARGFRPDVARAAGWQDPAARRPARFGSFAVYSQLGELDPMVFRESREAAEKHVALAGLDRQSGLCEFFASFTQLKNCGFQSRHERPLAG